MRQGNKMSVEMLEELKKTVAEVKEAITKSNDVEKDAVKEAIGEVLKNHPGFTPAQKIELPVGIKDMDEMDREKFVFEKMSPELVRKADDIFLLSLAMKKPANQLKAWQRFSHEMGDFKKALDTSTSGGTSEWIPTDFSSQFYELVRMESRVFSLFPSISMPSSPFTIPMQVGRIKTFKMTEQTANTGQSKIEVGDTENLSGNFTLTAVKHASRVLLSDEVEEDSIVPMLPWLREELVRAMAEGRDDAVLNGDSAGTHEDTDVTDATDRRKLWIGLRAIANDQSNKTDLSTFNLTNLRAMRKNMGKYGIMPSRLACVVGMAGYIKLLSLSEVVTVDKYGSNATILNGELAKIDGIPIIVSEWVRENLNASGVYDGVTTSKTVLNLVYTGAFLSGRRGTPKSKLLQELYAESGQQALIFSERLDFKAIYPVASNKTTYLGYNFN